jgi:hypothetical protein
MTKITDPAAEARAIKRAEEGAFTDQEILTFYENVERNAGSGQVLDAIRARMMRDFQKAAVKKFGAGIDEVTVALERLYSSLETEFDFSGNDIANDIKSGVGLVKTVPHSIYKYVSYRNKEKRGAQLALIRRGLDGELQVLVRLYQVFQGEDNSSDEKWYPFGELESAVQQYREHLKTIGVPTKT